MQKNHIIIHLLDQQYAQTACGEIVNEHPKVPIIKRYGFLDWKPNVNCQPCLRTAWRFITNKKLNQHTMNVPRRKRRTPITSLP